jgi:hypothetical protein
VEEDAGSMMWMWVWKYYYFGVMGGELVVSFRINNNSKILLGSINKDYYQVSYLWVILWKKNGRIFKMVKL